MNHTNYFLIFLFALIVLIFQACSEENTQQIEYGENQDTSDNSNTSNSVYIIDRTGMRWDISHAVNEYGMDPDNFFFGLGPDAIPPINNPEFITSGHDDFPVASGTFEVIGVNINGDRRAYPIGIFRKHEVVNDRVGGRFVSVTY